MCIDRSCANPFVAESGLHDSQVADAKKSGCERVTQHVRCQDEVSSLAGGVLESAFDRSCGDGKREWLRCEGVIRKAESASVGSAAPDCGYPVSQVAVDWDDPGSVAFGHVGGQIEGGLYTVAVDQVAPRQFHSFAYADSGVKHQIESEGVRMGQGSH